MSTPTRAVAAAAVALLLVAGIMTVASTDDSKHLTAYFERTVSLHPGAQVKVLGVGIGTVDSITVEGTRVRVELSYERDRDLPSGVEAALVPPSLLGDRFIQLTPPYTGGAVLPDGATLNTDRTAEPVEIDETYRGLDQLAKALGPQGANRDGALSQLISALAENLEGNGDAMNRTVADLSGAVDTLAAAGPDLAATVTNLLSISENLAANDSQVRSLVDTLATVSTELNGQRADLRTAVRTLGSAMAELAKFVQEHRPELATAIDDLATTTAAVTERKAELVELLDITPLAWSNLARVALPLNWDIDHPERVPAHARTSAPVSRFVLFEEIGVQLGHVMTAVCGQLPRQQRPRLAPLCAALHRTGNNLGEVASGLVKVLPTTSRPPESLGDILLGGLR